jgi:hypothetical protein
MKNITILSILLIYSITTFGQNTEITDSIKIMDAIKKVQNNFDNPNYENFSNISTTEIYCNFCIEKKNSFLGPYRVKRKEFFDKYLKMVNENQIWIKSKKLNNIYLLRENKKWSDITALITIWKKNEIVQGHEGSQLGIHFKKINDDFKFAGIETIP